MNGLYFFLVKGFQLNILDVCTCVRACVCARARARACVCVCVRNIINRCKEI